MTIPMKPNKPPPTSTANNTQKLASPVLLPCILGISMFPSNCCNMIMNITKYMHCLVSTIRSSNADGIAPMNGPKNGIILVIPIMK